MKALKDESTFLMKADKIIAFEDLCSHILCILAILIYAESTNSMAILFTTQTVQVLMLYETCSLTRGEPNNHHVI